MAMSISKLFLQQNRPTRLIITIVGIFVALLILFRIVILSANKRIEALERIIPQKQIKLKELLQIKEQYLDLKNQLNIFEDRVIKTSQDSNPTSWLKSQAKEIGLEVTEVKEATSSFLQGRFQERVWQFNLSSISLEQLTQYLYKIETQDSPAGIKRVFITKKPKQGKLIDVMLEAYVLIRNE